MSAAKPHFETHALPADHRRGSGTRLEGGIASLAVAIEKA